MKLTRYELMRATKAQLAGLGIKRANSKGWLRLAMLADWSPSQVEAFRRAAIKPQLELFVAYRRQKPREPKPYANMDAEKFATTLYEQLGRNLS